MVSIGFLILIAVYVYIMYTAQLTPLSEKEFNNLPDNQRDQYCDDYRIYLNCWYSTNRNINNVW